MENGRYFLKAIFSLYLSVTRETLRSFALSWKFLAVHVALVAIGRYGLHVATLLPRLPGSVLFGFVSGALLSVYFVSVSAAVLHERVSVRELVARAVTFFPKVMGLLFFLFVISFTVRIAADSVEVLLTANLLIAITWNTLFETAYQEDDDTPTAIRRSFAFVRENALEWFLPLAAAAFIAGVFAGLLNGLRLTVVLFAMHPIQLFELILRVSRMLGHWGLPTAAALLVLVYLIFIFRGTLYKHLARSNRRKRIFDARFS